ncbi:fibronectin type III domain-containing protein [Microcoleus sp. FACHB-831]|uniref:fibronectin type III domain-containing protein n=1 Tax=Microcoleus sp. FACHB-831 TaxID=2692827 RepID=UPI001686A2DD|nr:fibronectin type III domain-containing protein [Microcoleus sp. FACHB-831]MBD1921953.1 fibronectin type III domain-containing protein [Microcoleus sp. FACHB-831]
MNNLSTSIHQKVRVGAIAICAVVLTTSTAYAWPRPKCTGNDRGIGSVSVTGTSSSQVGLEWSSPGESFIRVKVCFKESWDLANKCKTTSKYPQNPLTRDYSSPAKLDYITISGLKNKECYKFAVYGVNGSINPPLIGEVKAKTN